MLVAAVLVKDKLVRVSFATSDKGDLRVHDPQEEVMVVFRKNLDLRLTGWLHIEVIAVTGDTQGESRGQLIGPYVTIEQLGIDGDLLVLFRRSNEGRI